MAYQPIENYGIIGNMPTAALVGMNGSIDWYCYPHFDSPSIFGALLDDQKGGRFRISPISDAVRYKQLYWPSTNILITRFLLADGIVEVEDFMPVGLAPDSMWYHHLCRRVRCVRGAVRLSLLCQPAFNYGRDAHQVQLMPNGVSFSSSDAGLALSSTVPLQHGEQGSVTAEFCLEEGGSAVFLLRARPKHESVTCPPPQAEAEELFQRTVKFWQNWLSHCTYRGRWREQVQRSALALKLLTFEPTGAIVAAPTTSLPETIGGVRNWDYRYTWIRDAAFTVYGFLRIGFREEAFAFMNWIEHYAARKYIKPKVPFPVLLTVHGEIKMPEQTLEHWEGYCGSRPVRIGNAASSQLQLDLYGELLDAFYLYNKYVRPISYDMWVKLRSRLNWICEYWQHPDAGVWEMRNREEHFVYSKVMNWVALDRGIRLADKRAFPADRMKWIGERDRIYEEVMTRGWNEKRRAFTQFYGSEDLDASLLIMPLVFFMASSDPRMQDTVAAILQNPREGGLVSDGLVYRYPTRTSVDGLPGEEGTFNMCSFWLVEALTRAAQAMPEKLNQARLLLERMLPQAFTHLSLISAAFNLDRALGN